MMDWLEDFILLFGAAFCAVIIVYGLYLWVTNGFEYWEE